MKKLLLFALFALLPIFVPNLAHAQAPYRNAALTSTANVKAQSGVVYAWHIYNPNASACSVDIFNSTAASVTLGTTVPVLSLEVGATASVTLSLSEPGIFFSNAISVAAVTAAGGNTTCTTGVIVNLLYQ